jgi:hypothetical protein
VLSEEGIDGLGKAGASLLARFVAKHQFCGLRK